jgi:hypothetical protein
VQNDAQNAQNTVQDRKTSPQKDAKKWAKRPQKQQKSAK